MNTPSFEPIVLNAYIQGSSVAVQPTPANVAVEQIPNKDLYQRFKTDLGTVYTEAELNQIVAFTHHVIHRVVLEAYSLEPVNRFQSGFYPERYRILPADAAALSARPSEQRF